MLNFTQKRAKRKQFSLPVSHSTIEMQTETGSTHGTIVPSAGHTGLKHAMRIIHLLQALG